MLIGYRENHPNIVVYNQDCSLVLKYAADLRDQRNGDKKAIESLMSLENEPTALPLPPEVGEVDLIMGGPPCQPFSGFNRHKVYVFYTMKETILILRHRKWTTSGFRNLFFVNHTS